MIFLDEATQLSEYQMKTIVACVRGVNDFPKRVYFTCNPGGQGHGYIKRLFIDRRFESGENPADYAFIQALVRDNTALMQTQPEYIRQLEALPPHLREMWLEGRWDVFAGQFFEEFRLDPDPELCQLAGVTPEEAAQQHRFTHVIAPFRIPRGWKIYRSYDFGYNRPFSLAWWAVDYDGVLYRIKELYGCTGEPNEGVRQTPDEQFRRAVEIERTDPLLAGRKIEGGVADPACWDTSRGESVQETAGRYGIYFEPGDNARIAGWMQCHYRLQFDAQGYARCYIFDTCKDFIRTIPLLMYAKTKPEDVDTELEDHCLTGDTLVLTEDGYRPIERLVGTTGHVMSSDGKLHRYGDVRKTRTNAEILEIELEDGTKIRCTDDHRFMLPDGAWVRAADLSAGMEVKSYGSSENQQDSPAV